MIVQLERLELKPAVRYVFGLIVLPYEYITPFPNRYIVETNLL